MQEKAGTIMAALEHSRIPGASIAFCCIAAGVLGAGLLLATPAAVADSGQRIHRCLGPHGETVFSGLPCSALGPDLAKPAAPAASGAREDAGAVACPATPADLQARIADAVTRQDANALAALLRWDGFGTGSAARAMAELRKLVAQPLLAAEPGPDGRSMEIRTGQALTGPVQAIDFRVTTDGACLWLGW